MDVHTHAEDAVVVHRIEAIPIPTIAGIRDIPLLIRMAIVAAAAEAAIAVAVATIIMATKTAMNLGHRPDIKALRIDTNRVARTNISVNIR